MSAVPPVAAAQILQASLAEVGTEAEVLPYDSGVYWNPGLESEGDGWRALQIIFMRCGGSLNGYDILKWLGPDQVGIRNRERLDDPEMGALLEAAQVELDDETRAGHFRGIQDIMELSGAYIFLTHGAAAAIYRDGLGIAARPDFVPQLRRFERV